jgi:tetratricopeptide (TPR) repeat protein
VTLEELTVEESGQLLSAHLGKSRVAAEQRPVRDIIARCARLPLALAIVAARAAHHQQFPLSVFADELRDVDDRLEVLAGGEASADVGAVFSWSYGALTSDAARLFRLLGLCPGPDISVAAAASLAGVPARQVRTVLAELVRANLVVEPVYARFAMHDLLRAYAGRLASVQDSDEQRRAAYRRLLDHYLQTAYTAALLLEATRAPIALVSPDPVVTPEQPQDHDQALAWFVAEHANLLAAINLAAGIGSDAHVWQLAWTLATFLDRQAEWDDWVQIQLAAVNAAQRQADPVARAQAHRLLAGAFLRLDRVSDADTHLRIALDMHRQANDSVGEGHTWLDISRVSMMQGDNTAALGEAQRALALFESAGERAGQGDALNAVGWFHILLGDYELALAACERALGLQQELGDRPGQGATWDSLGYAHMHREDYPQAIASFDRAIEVFREIDDRYQQADTLTRLGDAHSGAGDVPVALDVWKHALSIFTELDHPDADEVRAKIDRLGHCDRAR